MYPWNFKLMGMIGTLGLWLTVKEGVLRAQRVDGQLLLTHEESEAARVEERQARLATTHDHARLAHSGKSIEPQMA